MIHVFVIAFITIISCVSARIAHSSDVKFHDFTLENGLRVVVAPDHTAPVITHMLLVRAGAADDASGASGVAHYLEHMLFKGTPTIAEGEYSRRIEELGGQYNAFTSADMTGYYVTVASSHIDTVMMLEADRMQHIQPSPESYSKERDVVLEERRLRVDNNPSALLAEAVNAAMFRHHPYRIPIIGWQHEITQLDEVNARNYLRKHYTPANIVLLLVGDITQEQARKQAQRHYGAWHGAPRPSRQWVSEPPQRGQHSVTLRHDHVRVPRVSYHYIAPSFGTASQSNQIMPLILAESLLGDVPNGLLYKELVESRKLASSVSVGYNTFHRGPAIFSVHMTLADGAEMATLEQAYTEVIKAFIASPIEERALQRTRNQLNASTLFARDSNQGMAFIIGQLLMLDADPALVNHWSDYVNAVTDTQIIQSINDVVDHSHHVTGYLYPKAE